MSFTAEQLQSVMVGSQENRIEGLQQLLAYPLKQRDPEGSRFWYLRPGADEDEAQDTCPISVGFYSELNQSTDGEVKQFLTADEQQNEIYGHYTQRIVPNQPVMYLLLPEVEGSGRVAMVLPSEGKLRQRQIQSFAWTDRDLQARLNRLSQGELARTNRIQEKALSVIPLVEWVFYEPIKTAKELAEKLAGVSRRIEQSIPAVYEAERQDGYLHGLLTSFQRELLPTLKLKPVNDKDYSFADIYAQTIAYGLFTARVFSYTVDERSRQVEQNPERKETDFNRQNAWECLPETNPFLRRLFRDVSQQPIAELGEDLADSIGEVFSILRAAKMDAILADFRAKMNREDIVIRFYEDFLAAYKPQMRERRGVYYTPEPVVSYMVRSVDILLKEKFDKPLGLADPEVMILDPACGTGTFLLWIFQLIYQRFQEDPEALTVGLEDRSWSGYVKERLLPRIFGFELLMAPYAIAHLKLGLFLEETGYRFDSGKRLGVYLTNTLEEAAFKSESLFKEFIAEESDEAAKVKRDLAIMIVIGNPPYSGHSANNKIPWIGEKVKDYYFVDGQPLGERNPKWLQDDYVKFIRFGQWRIDQTQQGILSFITNHGYLDNPTFRGMRQSLEKSFDSIYVMDLHGNTKKKEVAPNGSKDENVFDIQQGVSVCMMLKEQLKGV
jgi:type I restriction-modification system DNA methylase subunit